MSQRTTQRRANQAISLPTLISVSASNEKAYVASVLELVRHRRLESHFDLRIETVFDAI